MPSSPPKQPSQRRPRIEELRELMASLETTEPKVIDILMRRIQPRMSEVMPFLRASALQSGVLRQSFTITVTCDMTPGKVGVEMEVAHQPAARVASESMVIEA